MSGIIERLSLYYYFTSLLFFIIYIFIIFVGRDNTRPRARVLTLPSFIHNKNK